jgi:hypothetical protein
VVSYNTEHRHSGILYVTPNERHEGRDIVILKHPEEVYANAKRNKPERRAQNTRNWSFIEPVELNPEVKTLAA